MNGTKALQARLPVAQDAVTELEKEWADLQKRLAEPGISDQQRESLLVDAQRNLDGIKCLFADLPPDNSDVKALQDRIAKVAAARQIAAGDAEVMQYVDRINRFMELYKDDFAGMDAENPNVTWQAFKGGGAATNYFGAEKTHSFVSRVSGLLSELETDQGYVAVKNNPKIKSIVDPLQAKVTAGRQKLTKAANAVVTQMEQEKLNSNTNGPAGALRDTVRSTLGEDSAEVKPLLAPIDKATSDFEKATAGAETASAQYYKDMTDKATAAWPAMESKFTVASGFDPTNPGAFKGKLINVTTNNLMGYRFKPGDFAFATTLNGLPIAGRYDPAVASAISDIESKIHRGLGDSDDDGKWTIIARVEGTMGRLIQKVNREGDVKVDGQKVGTITGVAETPVDAPIITILAAHVGPLAAAAGMPAVATAAPPAGMQSNAGGASATPLMSTPVAAAPAAEVTTKRSRSFVALLSALLAIIVGAACLMKAGFAPIAANATAADMATKIGSQNIAYLGLVGIVWGVIGLLSSLLALIHAPLMGLISLVACAALIVAGFTTSRGLLEQNGLVKPDLSAKLTAFSIPAGLASAGLGVLMLLMWVIR